MTELPALIDEHGVGRFYFALFDVLSCALNIFRNTAGPCPKDN